MAEPFIGELRAFPYNFAPRGWALCEGQLLPIAQNTALFSLLGTTFGGDGRTTFGLPDLRGRVPVGEGQGPGLSDRRLGERFGSEAFTLTPSTLPQHSHNVRVHSGPANTYTPGNPAVTDRKVYGPATPGQFMDGQAVATAGQSLAHENRRPLLALSWCIALQGIFPSRN